MLLAVHHRVTMHAGSLESIKKQEFLRFVQPLTLLSCSPNLPRASLLNDAP